MYSSGQTLQHIETGKLVRLAHNASDTVWVWSTDQQQFIGEDGKRFADDIKKYTHIEDELGHPVVGRYKKNGKPDMSLKKYVGVDLTQMRQETLLRLESETLAIMKTKNWVCSSHLSSSIFSEFFLERRGAFLLYKDITFDTHRDGPKLFYNEGKTWIYERCGGGAELTAIQLMCDLAPKI